MSSEAAGKCQVIAHTGHHSAEETIELTRHAQQAGADFVVVINPYYPAADEGLYAWFARVCARGHRRLAVRHPVRAGKPLAGPDRAAGR